jgi:3',5'-cyclic AMP phosphodiesterase CpdA
VLVAHFSDIHLLSLRGARPLDFAGKRITGGANLLLNRGGHFPLHVAEALIDDLNAQALDHVILSGDLTNLALPAELELVRGLLERLLVGRRRITVVPGNHDAYTRAAVARDDFGRVLEPFLHGDRQPGPGRFPLLRLQGELAVLALSSAVPSPPLMAVGKLGAAQLAAAGELLGSDECRERFRLVVLHHPPAHPEAHWHNRLVDQRELLALLRRTGAELVVHGHLHRFSQLWLPGPSAPIPMVGVGSGTFLGARHPERRAQYNLYELEGRRLVRVRRRRWESSTGAFEEI